MVIYFLPGLDENTNTNDVVNDSRLDWHFVIIMLIKTVWVLSIMWALNHTQIGRQHGQHLITESDII